MFIIFVQRKLAWLLAWGYHITQISWCICKGYTNKELYFFTSPVNFKFYKVVFNHEVKVMRDSGSYDHTEDVLLHDGKTGEDWTFNLFCESIWIQKSSWYTIATNHQERQLLVTYERNLQQIRKNWKILLLFCTYVI